MKKDEDDDDLFCKDFDDILTVVGSQGKYQKMLLYGD